MLNDVILERVVNCNCCICVSKNVYAILEQLTVKYGKVEISYI